MRRRDLMLLLGALLTPCIAAAQDKRRPRLAIFAPLVPEAELFETGGAWNYRIFFEELRRRGYEEGRNLDVGRWSARGDRTRYPELAREIVRSQPDVIYTVHVDQVQALLAHTTTIPIIIGNPLSSNLVAAGLADSISRPGRNVTGLVINFSGDGFLLKQMQLLREAMPTASRVAALALRAHWDSDGWRPLREAASRMGLTLVGALMEEFQPPEYRRAFAAMAGQHIDAVYVPYFTSHWVHRHLIIDLAVSSRLPAITFLRENTERGGLMSYGLDQVWPHRTLAEMIARVLQGEKPAEMPLRGNDKTEFVINLKTARALGITIPQSLLLSADEVIE